MIQWNDINGVLPEDGFYLVRCPHYCEAGYCVAEFDNNLFAWYHENDETIDSHVTHWAEINEPSAAGKI